MIGRGIAVVAIVAVAFVSPEGDTGIGGGGGGGNCGNGWKLNKPAKNDMIGTTDTVVCGAVSDVASESYTIQVKGGQGRQNAVSGTSTAGCSIDTNVPPPALGWDTTANGTVELFHVGMPEDTVKVIFH